MLTCQSLPQTHSLPDGKAFHKKRTENTSRAFSTLFCKLTINFNNKSYHGFYDIIQLSLLKRIQISLEHIRKLPDMYPIRKRMMSLDRYGHHDLTLLLIILPPVKQRRRIILFPGIGM